MTYRSGGEAISVELPLRVAALDIGSNAVRLVIAEFARPDRFEPLLSERLPIRLGSGSFGGGSLPSAQVKEILAALRRFRTRLDDFGVRAVRAVATSAVRESSNSEDLIEGARTVAGFDIQPISGEEEGRLVWEALRPLLPDAHASWLLADLGGGSLELSLTTGGQLSWIRSLPLGTVRLLGSLENGGSALSMDEVTRRVDARIASAGMPDLPGGLAGVVATGGNADALAGLVGASIDEAGMRFLPLHRLRSLSGILAPLSCEERVARYDLREDRADVIVPAGVVLARLAEAAGAAGLRVAAVGLKEGVLLSLAGGILRSDGAEAARGRRVEHASLAIGRRCRFDEEHARQVTRIALRLFDELTAMHGLEDGDRTLLLAAALLHDIGNGVASSRRHRHSCFIIRHNEIDGLSQKQVELVALIARYHRGSRPRRIDRSYGALEDDDRKRVRKLAALLCIADGLGSAQHPRVNEIAVSGEAPQDDAAPATVLVRLLLPVAATSSPWPLTASRRRLFERAFDRTIRICAVPDPANTSTPSPR